MNGVGCPQCSKENLSKSLTKSHEWYLNELKIKNPTVIPIDQYVDMKTHITHKCLIHNIEWKPIPSNVLKGCGCSLCLKERIAKKSLKSNEQYIQELQEYNNNIVPLEPYINTCTSILHKCLICGYEWKVKPANLLSKKGCPNCANNIKRTQEQYIQLLKDKNPNIEVQENYINANTPIYHKCLKHDCIWKVAPTSIINGGGCYKCGLEKLSKAQKKTNQAYVNELKIKNPTIINLEEYRGNNINIKLKCLKCNHEWIGNPENPLQGHGCPRCRISKGEERIEQWLITHNINYIPQKKFNDCKDIFCLPFDYYIPNDNKCIEYDGRQHFTPIAFFGGQKALEYLQRHDQIKNEYCEKNNIPLLRIPYYANVEEELEKFLA
jgi:formate dehydrogenase assembly factor FdhD